MYGGAVLAVFIGFCEWGLRVWGSYVGGCMSFKPGNIANPKGRAGHGFRMRCGTDGASRKRRLCLSFFISPHFHWCFFNFQFFRVCLLLLYRECIVFGGSYGGRCERGSGNKYLSKCTGFASAANRAFLQKHQQSLAF